MSATVTLAALGAADIESVMALGKRIWLTHYVPLIGREQVDYMIGQRFREEVLRGYLGAADRWFDVLRVDGELQGYCSYALTATPGQMKLEQLYLAAERRGLGHGGVMLRHVEARAAGLDCDLMVLQVNKRNSAAIAVYGGCGYTVREAAVFDIGEGFVMDDYIMERRLAP